MNQKLVDRVFDVRKAMIEESVSREGMWSEQQADSLTIAYFLAELVSSDAKEEAKEAVVKDMKAMKAMKDTKIQDFDSRPGPSCYRG